MGGGGGGWNRRWKPTVWLWSNFKWQYSITCKANPNICVICVCQNTHFHICIYADNIVYIKFKQFYISVYSLVSKRFKFQQKNSIQNKYFHRDLNTTQKKKPNIPCICTRNSVLILLADSLSFSLLEPHKESTSSMKIIAGLLSRASSNNCFTSLQNNADRFYLQSLSIHKTFHNPWERKLTDWLTDFLKCPMNTQDFHKCEWVSNKISEDWKLHPLYMYM